MGIFHINKLTNNGINKTFYQFELGKLGKINSKYVREKFLREKSSLYGKYTEYIYRTKEIKQQGVYKNGKKDGEWEYSVYDKRSLLKKRRYIGERRWCVSYKDGILHGPFKVYKLFYCNKIFEHLQVLIEDGNCINGKKEGEWKYFTPKKEVKDGSFGMKSVHYSDDKTSIYSLKWNDGILKNPENMKNNNNHPDWEKNTPEIFIDFVENHKENSDDHIWKFINRI